MSSQQEEFCQAAIVELDVCKSLELLQRNSIDLNEPIEVNGRNITFLHELLQVAVELFRDRIIINQSISDDLGALLMGPLGIIQFWLISKYKKIIKKN